MTKILIVPIGSVDLEVLKNIALALEKIFHCRATLSKEMTIPEESFNYVRKQHNSTIILEKIKILKPRNSNKILGVTDVDLYFPELNFVFGEANISSGISIISLTRLRQEFYGLRPDKRLFIERSVKEAIHEVGHTYGLSHCPHQKCIMHFSNTLRETDIKGPGFCTDCRKKLGI